MDDILKNTKTYQDYESLVTFLLGEKRLHDRQPFTNPFKYTILSSDAEDEHRRSFADTVDICLNGLGIRTNIKLEPGHIIRLKNDNENIRGIVRWIAPEHQGDRYRAGIQFI